MFLGAKTEKATKSNRDENELHLGAAMLMANRVVPSFPVYTVSAIVIVVVIELLKPRLTWYVE